MDRREPACERGEQDDGDRGTRPPWLASRRSVRGPKASAKAAAAPSANTAAKARRMRSVPRSAKRAASWAAGAARPRCRPWGRECRRMRADRSRSSSVGPPYGKCRAKRLVGAEGPELHRRGRGVENLGRFVHRHALERMSTKASRWLTGSRSSTACTVLAASTAIACSSLLAEVDRALAMGPTLVVVLEALVTRGAAPQLVAEGVARDRHRPGHDGCAAS
jgi:hypothetical protein